MAFNCVPESTKTIKNHFMSVLLDFVAKCLPMFLVMPLRSPTFLKKIPALQDGAPHSNLVGTPCSP